MLLGRLRGGYDEWGDYEPSLIERIRARVHHGWYLRTRWARFEDGAPGDGIMAPRCQMPLRFLPQPSRFVWQLRGRNECGAFVSGKHWTHTYWPHPFTSVTPIPGYYPPSTEQLPPERVAALVSALEQRMAADALDAMEREARVRAQLFGAKHDN